MNFPAILCGLFWIAVSFLPSGSMKVDTSLMVAGYVMIGMGVFFGKRD